MYFILLFLASICFAKNVTVSFEDKVIRTHVSELDALSLEMHGKTKRCGGFVTSFDDQKKRLFKNINVQLAPDYTISKEELVSDYLKSIREERLLKNIEWFSSYHTRFYSTQTGKQAMLDLAAKWKSIVQHLNFAEVEVITHSQWLQPSIILTLKGETSESIVLGGHGDSINTEENFPHSAAPGADDNASGISVLTEVISVLAEKGYQPKHTIKFMAYAAEEVGLMGSMEISGKAAENNDVIRGVLQFDGTNFHGSRNFDIVLVTDHTNEKQNNFLGMIIDTYLKIPWGRDKCGYACSDHYSWTYRGYPASFAYESSLKEENSQIHTANDTLQMMNNSALHSVSFAKLGLAYVLELDK